MCRVIKRGKQAVFPGGREAENSCNAVVEPRLADRLRDLVGETKALGRDSRSDFRHVSHQYQLRGADFSMIPDPLDQVRLMHFRQPGIDQHQVERIFVTSGLEDHGKSGSCVGSLVQAAAPRSHP